MERATNRAHRETLFRKNFNQAADVNRPLLAEALEIRRRIAALLGHPTWAHYAMEVKMAADPERVAAFYDQLVPPLEAAARDEIGEMARMHAEAGATDELQPGLALLRHAPVDGASRRRPERGDRSTCRWTRLDGMFALTGDVRAGLRTRAGGECVAPIGPAVPHQGPRHGELIAHFYADLFPREGKFTHAAAFPLVIGHRAADGSYVKPVNAIVANFTPPSATRPSLLTHGPHGEIETLFHEFGHILHMSLTQAEFTRFSAAETEWDFVEAPSQIMEHWVWQPEILARFARHYQTGEPMPPELSSAWPARASSTWASAPPARSSSAPWTWPCTPRPMSPTWTPPSATAGASPSPYPRTPSCWPASHLMGGYDAGYYGYLWAEVIGDDMWGRSRRRGSTHRWSARPTGGPCRSRTAR